MYSQSPWVTWALRSHEERQYLISHRQCVNQAGLIGSSLRHSLISKWPCLFALGWADLTGEEGIHVLDFCLFLFKANIFIKLLLCFWPGTKALD